MTNSFKFNGVCTLLALVSLNTFADDSWIKREAEMQCGPALVQVNSECKIDPTDSTVNVCKNFQLNIKKDNKVKVLHLPYMPDNQRKLLESEGYTFGNIVKAGDWAPKTMKCYNDKYIVIGYALGLSEEETVKGSLLSYIDAPFFKFDGVFVVGDDALKLREQEIKDPYHNTNIDFIEKNSEVVDD